MPPPGPSPVRVRFAPSPTGHLHLGGARTALFNHLFARQRGGVFVLRIEDTDQERSTPAAAAAILEGLRWLGLEWDEGPERGGEYGPYYQSDRRPLYRAAAERLLAAGHAYPCYCRPEELTARREQAMAEKRDPKYDGRCRHLTAAARCAREAEGIVPAIRLALPPGEVAWDDLAHGRILFQNERLEDFVILKGDGFPTYNFAVVVDDASMRITHVIRGEDHVSNTPRHLLLYRALACDPPQFCHVPMILGADGARLSKRHGATSVSQYRDQGFLPAAMRNYLALLGWSTADSRQIFSPEELVAEFDLARVGKTPAVFDPEKLRWINGQHLAVLAVEERTERLLPFLERAGLPVAGRDRRWLEAIVELIGDRIRTMDEIGAAAAFFFRPVPWGEPELKILREAEPLLPALRAVCARLDALAPYDRGGIETVIRDAAAAAGIKAGKLIQPLRVAVAGRTVSPGLFESLELVGKIAVRRRLQQAWPALQSI